MGEENGAHAEGNHSCPHCAEIPEIKASIATLAEAVTVAAEGDEEEAEDLAEDAIALLFEDDGEDE